MPSTFIPCTEGCPIGTIDEGTIIRLTPPDPITNLGGGVWVQTVDTASGPITATFTLPPQMTGTVNGQTAAGFDLEHLTLSDSLTGTQTSDFTVEFDRPINECEDVSLVFFDINPSESLAFDVPPDNTTGAPLGNTAFENLWFDDPGVLTVTIGVVAVGVSVAFRIRETIRECGDPCESNLDCLEYKEDGSLGYKLDPDRNIECGPKGLRYNGILTPSLAGETTCKPRPLGADCFPIYKDPISERLWAPNCPSMRETVFKYVDNANQTGITAGGTWNSPGIPLPQGPNSDCLTANITYHICMNVSVTDGGKVGQPDIIAFSVTDFWNNGALIGVEQYHMASPVFTGQNNAFRVSHCRTFPVSELDFGDINASIYNFRIQNLSANDSNISIFTYNLTITREVIYMERCGELPYGGTDLL